MKQLPQNYIAKESEKRWQGYWNQHQTYAWDESQPRANTYVIDTPPPTVSGLLHMGHIFSYTQADFIARFQRMSGKTVFYPMGFDDNGLPTERLVEKTLKKRATDLGREAFIEECNKITAEARGEFRSLFESVALSVDWKQEYHTISEESRKISQMSFLDLLQKNQAYRKLQPMFWDPIDQTAIAQAEVEDKEVPSFENYIPFGLVKKGTSPETIKWAELEKVTIMTTRPELLGACVALMVHPDVAEKYKNYEAVTPLFGVVVPIVADEKVDKEKGTGFVMCCTFGDETDIKWWEKHKFDTRIVLNKYGKLDLSGSWLKPEKDRAFCSLVDEKWAVLNGLKAQAAREKTIEILKELNCLLEQKPITHAIKCAERSGAPLEILPTTQWFVKVIDHKDALKAKGAECNWHPAYMKVRLDQWIDGLAWDWCISRQRYFGVPFPVWYSKRAGEEGKVLTASANQLPVNPLVDLPAGYTRDEVEAEADVMDTWATSSASPQLSSKGISSSLRTAGEAIQSGSPRSARDDEFMIDSERHAKLFPADLRPQAHEIIRTWAFYTIVKAHLHENTIPWKNLMISGWCLASDKTKMSKSKGNVVTPVALIEEKGADAVRYWASTSRLGSDTAFSEDVLKIGNKLVNKLFNASKFAAIQLEAMEGTPTTALEDVKKGTITETLDLWLLTRLHRAVEKATTSFVEYEYADARVAIEDFFWNDFCDNYLEIVKKRAYGTAELYAENFVGKNPQQSAIYTIYHVLETVLRLFAPFVPHVTEELYSHIFEDKHKAFGSIHACGTWPNASDLPVNAEAEKAGIETRAILDEVRKAKAEKGVSVKWPIDTLSLTSHLPSLTSTLADIAAVTNARSVTVQMGEFIVSVSLSEHGDEKVA